MIVALLIVIDLAYGDLMIAGAVAPGPPEALALALVVVLAGLVALLPALLARPPLLRRPQSAPPVLRATAALIPLMLGWALAVIIISLVTPMAPGDVFAATGAIFALLLLHGWAFMFISRLAPERKAQSGISYGLAIAVVWSGVDLLLVFQGSLGFAFALTATGARLLILPLLGLIAGRWGNLPETAEQPSSPASLPRVADERSSTFGMHLLWILLAAVLLAFFFTPVSGGDLAQFAQFGLRVGLSWGMLAAGGAIALGLVTALARLRPHLPDLRRRVGRLLRWGAGTAERRTLWALLGVLLLIFWPYLDPYLVGYGTDARVSILGDIGFYVILALGLNIVVGFAGLLDLGYVAFFAIGAYCWALLGAPQFSVVSALLHQLDGLPLVPQHLPFGLAWAWWFWPCLFIGALVAAGCGVLLGAPVLRLRGDYLAIVTLGFGEIIPIVFKNLPRLTGGISGVDGVPTPILPGLAFPWFAATPFYYLILALIAVTIIACRRLRGARLGRSWEAMRDDQLAAATSGINTARVKLLAFSTGAFFSGMAGVYHAAKLGIIDPSQFNFGDSAAYVTMVVLGGMGSIPGVIAGATVIATLNLYLLNQLNAWSHDPTTILGRLPLINTIDFADVRNLIFGTLLFAMVVLRPEGLIPARARRADEEPLADPAAAPEPLPPPQTAPAEPLLRIQHLSKSFGGVTALDDFSLVVPPGQMVGIIGPNGSGKTTLFNLISGVVPPNPLPGTRLGRGARRVAALARRRPGRLVRWALGTALGLGVGLLFVIYVLNVVIFAAISDPTYLQPLVALCAIGWAVLWLAQRGVSLFLGDAGGLWAELDEGDGALSGYAGAVRLGDRELLGLPPEQVAARGVARTFQNVRLFDTLSVLDNLLVGQDVHLRATWLDALLRRPRMRREEAAARVRAAATLALFGDELAARQNDLAANLAYADKRRVEIARALVAEPQLLLLDEPTAGLNEAETHALLATLRQISDTRGLTVLLIEHKLAVIDAVDHVVVLDQGRLIAEGPPAAIRDNDQVIAAYLGRAPAPSLTSEGGSAH
jgi:ABC-type branched-subunit amino acid transport system ATPase component/ABC-type branched-subunit amino acid transport system permease subunit